MKKFYYRKDLTDILASSYYISYLNDFIECELIGVVEGGLFYLLHIQLLSVRPEYIDGHLQLKKDKYRYKKSIAKKYEDTNQFLVNLLFASPDATKKHIGIPELLCAPISLDLLDNPDAENDIQALDLINKIALLINSSLDLYVAFASPVYGDKEFLFRHLTRLNYKKRSSFSIKERELKEVLKANKIDLGKTAINYTRKNKGNRYVFVEETKKVRFIEFEGKSNVLRFETEIKPAVRTPEQVKGAAKLFNNPLFAKALHRLQIVNTSAALYELGKDISPKNVVNLLGAASDLTAAYINLNRTYLIASNTAEKIVRKQLERYRNLTRLGSAFTALYCGLESRTAFREGDTDAGIAFVASGAAFATLAIFSSMTFGVGLIIGGLAVGLYVLTHYLKDDDLEKYFKNFYLGNYKDFPKLTNEASWQYVNRFYQERASLMRNNEMGRTWYDVRKCYQHFLNLFNRLDFDIKGIIDNLKYKENISEGEVYKYSVRSGVANRISITIPLDQFKSVIHHSEQLECEVFVIDKSFHRTEKISVSEMVLVSKTDQKAMNVIIYIPPAIKKRYDDASYRLEMLFVCRLRLNDNSYYPYTCTEAATYFGVLFPLWMLDVENEGNRTLLTEYTYTIDEDRKQRHTGTMTELKNWIKNKYYGSKK